jgi:D-alanyl-D-alanine carboxypeptidase/D-alanyl-D-alanine-endopeptidase (penicillin-binding protein 4)
MRSKSKCWFFCLAIQSFALTLAPLAGSAQSLPATVTSLLATASIPSSSAAVLVQEVGSAKPLLAHNAGQTMNPASTMKLLTSYAALEILGPTFTWHTETYANGRLAGEVLEGDLVIRGMGDPKLTIENFWLLLRGLRARGLRDIQGDLVLDRSYFEAQEDDAGRFDSEPLRPYNVSPDALLLNFKTVRFTFMPGEDGKTVMIVAEPRPAQLELATAVRLVDGPCGDWRARLKADLYSNGTAARVNLSGAYPASCGEKTWNIALLGHRAYISGVFRQLWQELGGTIKGSVRDGTALPNARLLFTAESPALSEVVRDINKYSNNVMARQLFLTLSAEVLKVPANTGRSAQVVQSWLAQKSIDAPELVMENGSGLSRRERISAASMGKILISAWQSAVMPEFIASMPLVAYDGTMRRRLKFDNVAGQAHIKTGSLADVRAVAGYVRDVTGRRFAVVFIVNHANAAAAQPAQDALLRWVYNGASAK